MKLEDARDKTAAYYAFIVINVIGNKTCNGMIEHLNKRGKHTNFWVINDDDEVRHLVKNTPVQGIMSDRPTAVKKVIENETK